jgi:hypothetical protein
LDEFLDHIVNTTSMIQPDADEESEEDEMDVYEAVKQPNGFNQQLQSQPSVFEEGTNKNLLILVCGLVIIGLILFMILK